RHPPSLKLCDGREYRPPWLAAVVGRPRRAGPAPPPPPRQPGGAGPPGEAPPAAQRGRGTGGGRAGGGGHGGKPAGAVPGGGGRDGSGARPGTIARTPLNKWLLLSGSSCLVVPTHADPRRTFFKFFVRAAV